MPALKCRFAIHLGLGSLSFVKIARDNERWRVVAYGDVPWQSLDRTNEDHHVHLEALLKSLVNQQSLTRESVHVSLHSRFCVSRVVTGSKQEVDAQFDEIATNSQHYLQFGLGEKLIGRSKVPGGDGEDYGQVAIIKRGLFENIDRAFHRSSLRIDSIDGAMPNICRLIGHAKLDESPLLMVWLSDSSAEIGISYQGRLQLTYQLGGNTSPDAVADTIRKHLKRLRRFCDRYRSVNESVKLNHLLILASESHASALRQDLEGSVFEQVLSLDDVIRDKLSDHFVLGEKLPSPGVATALGGLLPQVEADILPFTDVLQHYNSSKPRTLRSILLADAWPMHVATAVLIALTLSGNWMQQRIDYTMQHTRMLEVSLAAEREQMLKLDDVRSQIKDIHDYKEMMFRISENKLIERIAECLPSDTRIETFAIDATGKLVLKGTMLHGDQSYELLQTLRNSPAIDEVSLETVGKASSFGVATTLFEINCVLTEQASEFELSPPVTADREPANGGEA